MSTRNTPWEPGTPCWVDLMSPDAPSAEAFYSDLFGWQIQDTGEQTGHYGICRKNGLAVAGIGAAQPGGDIPTAWTTYLASDDIDRTRQAVLGSAGSILAGPHTVPDRGRMLVAQDPTGAVFGVWQATTMIGFQWVNEAGGVVWNDCSTRDPHPALRFYTAVFGYTYSAAEGQDDYWTIDGGGPGGTVAGIRRLDPLLPDEVAAHWMTYFVVDHVDTGVAIVATHGGSVRTPAVDTPNGRMAIVADPHGAVFTICQRTKDTFTG